MAPAESTAARERLLDVAEELFAAKGFDSVTLRDIGSRLGLTHASIYYHFPGGKEDLFAEVMERNIRRHGEGLDRMINAGGVRLRGKLRGAASWLVSQPPMDLLRLAQTDLKVLEPAKARRIMDLVYELMMKRIEDEIAAAESRGEVGPCDAGLLAGGIVGMVESLHTVPLLIVGRKREDMAFDLIEVLLKGIDYREGGT